MTAAPSPPEALRRATRAVYAVFILSGFVFASWASRIPQVRDALELTPRSLGLVLLAMAVGSVISMPLAGVVVGAARDGAHGRGAWPASPPSASRARRSGTRIGVAPVVVGLFLLGLGYGTWDVAMNVEGADVERALGRAIMPRFHAGFSVGTVAGALVGAAWWRSASRSPRTCSASRCSSPSRARLRARLPPGRPPRRGARRDRGRTRSGVDGAAHAAHRPVRVHRRLHRGHRQRLARRRGHRRLRRGARARLADLRGLPRRDDRSAAGSGPGSSTAGAGCRPSASWPPIALAGLVLVVFGGSLPVAIAGAALWGLGTALGFPVGMSAASDDPRQAAGRVSVVASIGYVAFLAGPPLIGFLGDEVGTLRALTATGGLVALGLLISGVLRPLPVPERAPAAEPVGAPR